MWFIDDSLTKNKNYYTAEANAETEANVTLNICYGGTLFEQLFNRMDVWNEICAYLTRNKRERNNEILQIPDFDTSQEILVALKKLKQNEPKLYEKLSSNQPAYVHLRNELFPTGQNLNNV